MHVEFSFRKIPIKNAVTRLLEFAGYRISSIQDVAISCESSFLGRYLEKTGVNVIFDIGAHSGQYGAYLRKIGYKDRIVSFEPQANAYLELLARANRDPDWIAINAALGSIEEMKEINITENSYSSSFLDLRSDATAIEPSLSYITTEKVAVCRLDDVYPKYVKPSDVIFLKLDTQGYEPHILSGAVGILKKCIGLQIEMALSPTYADQWLMPEIINLLGRQGFKIVHVQPCFIDPSSGYTLEVDGVFVPLEDKSIT